VSAKVQTLGDRVVDAFYVRSASGAKLEDPALLVEVERALLHELSA
jgi:UTP:GlnB (protein PII) uridylyltransferase